MGTSKKVASRASKVLSNPQSTKGEKSAAASSLTQFKTEKETTSKKVASRASEVLSNPQSTKAEKSAAASALAQRRATPKSGKK